ncbi:translation initiation factor [Halobacterium salinarum]|jgi:translation initiation factor 1|nr:translation initiation factor [Halobacterium salinarum]MCF2240044.1 translation initiation factor [Halobacterium salinarum]
MPSVQCSTHSTTGERTGCKFGEPLVPDDDPLDDLDVPEDPLADLDRATEQLTVRSEERRYGKTMVIIEGFEGDTDRESLASELKSALGTGGTVKQGHIELQGDHEERVRELLEENGYSIRG